MKSLQSKDNLIWIDLEMTGLDPEKEKIIEIATLITDSQLNILAEGPNLIINQPKSLLDEMDEWNQNQHGSSGLIDAVKKSSKKKKVDFVMPIIKEEEKKKTVEVMPSKKTHTVRKGDTLYSISKRYNTTVDQLKKWNKLNSNTISIDQVLKVN